MPAKGTWISDSVTVEAKRGWWAGQYTPVQNVTGRQAEMYENNAHTPQYKCVFHRAIIVVSFIHILFTMA